MTLAFQPGLGAHGTAELAVAALHTEIDLSPKPGLIDRRGPGAHTDMTLAMLHDSAESLHAALRECFYTARELDVGPGLRARIGLIGRKGEEAMLDTTGGVNTHRGALWALGLLAAAVGAGATTTTHVTAVAAALARYPDPAIDQRAASNSHGAQARRRYGISGALGQAQAGFPHVIRHALPAVRAGRPLDGLLSVMAHLDDTCLLHRGGARGLADVQAGARAVLAAGGMDTSPGRQRFFELDCLCIGRRLSPGGSGDLLAAALFLDALERRSAPRCRP
jgi:triphosphoribosyl-dephospho-CoA synthase